MILNGKVRPPSRSRSEEHTSELQSLRHLVCRLLLEKKKMYDFFLEVENRYWSSDRHGLLAHRNRIPDLWLLAGLAGVLLGFDPAPTDGCLIVSGVPPHFHRHY